MRKFLLFASAALFAVSTGVDAQNARKGIMKAQVNAPVVTMKSQPSDINRSYDKNPGQLVKKRPAPENTNIFMQADFINSLQPVAGKKLSTAAPRKVGQVQEQYIGSGTDYFESTNVTWDMYSDEFDDGTPALINVVPDCFGSENGVALEYYIEGNEVVIEPQIVASNGNWYAFFCDLYSVRGDGSAVFTLGENGSLTPTDGAYLAFAAFSSDRFDPNLTHVNNGGTFGGSYQIITNAKYQMLNEIGAPSVSYEPQGLYLHNYYTPNGYSTTANVAMVGAYAEIPFKNMTADPTDTWAWSITSQKAEEDAVGEVVYADDVTTTGSEKEFTFKTIGGSVYTPAVLKGAYDGNESEPFIWGMMNSEEDEDTGVLTPNYESAYVYAGHQFTSADPYDQLGIVSRANPDNESAYYSFLGTPDVNSQQYSFSHLIFYQGKPSAPLYIEGVNLWVQGFQAKENFNLKCKIQKAERNGNFIALGDVIAESDISIEDVYSVENPNVSEYNWALLNWTNFYVEDEWGLSNTLDHLFLEDEFAIVLEGWDNGSFSAFPRGEYSNYEYGEPTVYMYQTGKEPVGDNLVGFTSLYAHIAVGFINAAYGYLHTEDNTALTFGANGGEATVHVKPMFYSTDENDNVKTRIFLDEAEEYELPDWLDVNYTDPEGSDDISFDLIVKADALPADAEAREAQFAVWQEGAKLVVTVKQGADLEGITTVTVKKADDKVYNLIGQRTNSTKGILVKNGRKFIVK